MKRIAVVGDGGWGSALALLLNRSGHRVTVWSPFEAAAAEVVATHRNERFLPGIDIPEGIRWTSDRTQAVHKADVILWVVPTRYFRSVVQSFLPLLPETALQVSASKGLEEGTLLRMTEVVEDLVRGGPVVALSGPTFAEEVARGLPSAAVAACRDATRAIAAQEVFGGDRFRVYTSGDVIGVEMGGALKNVIALAAGVCDGIGAGTNARAALITRGLAEIARLGLALGARAETFAGLSGMGDLVLTCTGPLSRNRKVGERLGRGERLQDILDGMAQVAEGVATARNALSLSARARVAMPIVHEVVAVLDGVKDPRRAVGELMGRAFRSENDRPAPEGV
jgi:glycerol-3-phosphate dehydrogenase (NAD(P)+)